MRYIDKSKKEIPNSLNSKTTTTRRNNFTAFRKYALENIIL